MGDKFHHGALTLGTHENREGRGAGHHLQGPHGLQDSILKATQHQHYNDTDKLGPQPIARQSLFGGLVKQQVAIERQEGRHAYDGIHVHIGIDRIHL